MSRVFIARLHQIVTLDDDLMGTRAHDNQVKTLSSRKSDKEGHLADVIADALFSAVLSVRFSRRSEGQEEAAIANVEKLLRKSGQLTLS